MSASLTLAATTSESQLVVSGQKTLDGLTADIAVSVDGTLAATIAAAPDGAYSCAIALPSVGTHAVSAVTTATLTASGATSITVPGPASGSWVGSSPLYVVQSYTYTNGVLTINLDDNTGNNLLTTTYVDGVVFSGGWGNTGVSQAIFAHLTPGDHVITFDAIDAGKHPFTITFYFTVPQSSGAPASASTTTQVQTPAAIPAGTMGLSLAANISGNQLVISGQKSLAGVAADIQITLDETLVDTIAAAPDGTFSCSIAVPPTGAHAISASTDATVTASAATSVVVQPPNASGTWVSSSPLYVVQNYTFTNGVLTINLEDNTGNALLTTTYVDGVVFSGGWGNTGPSQAIFAHLSPGDHVIDFNAIDAGNHPFTITFYFTVPQTVATAPPPSGGNSATTPPVGAVVNLPSIPQAAVATDIAGIVFQNNTSAAQGARYDTFGHVFVQGKVHPGDLLNLNGSPVQMDVKATHPDGSVRFAVLSVAVPALAAGVSVSGMLSRGGAPVASKIDLTKVATGLKLLVDVTGAVGNSRKDTYANTYLNLPAGATTVGGDIVFQVPVTLPAPQTLDIDALFQAAVTAGTLTYWVDGPNCVDVQFGDVSVLCGYHLPLSMRVYADGKWRFEFRSANDHAQAQYSDWQHDTRQPMVAGDVTYNLTLSQNAKTIWQQTSITQWQYSAPRHLVWSDAPVHHVVLDPQNMIDAGAIARYDGPLKWGVSQSAITGYVTSMTADNGFDGWLGRAGFVYYFGQTGGRPDIGITTDAATIWLVTQNEAIKQYCLTQAEAAGSPQWGLFDPDTGTYLDPADPKYVSTWYDVRGGSSGTTPVTQPPPTSSPWGIDTAHQPDMSYVPFLMTGDKYNLDMLLAQAVFSVFSAWPGPRNNQTYPVTNENETCLVVNGFDQVRGQGWALRQLVNANFIMPDSHPLKASTAKILSNNFSFMLNTWASFAQGDLAGVWYNLDQTDNLGPWQEDYLSSSIISAVDKNIPLASQVLAVNKKWLTQRILADKTVNPASTASWYAMDCCAYYISAGPAVANLIVSTAVLPNQLTSNVVPLSSTTGVAAGDYVMDKNGIIPNTVTVTAVSSTGVTLSAPVSAELPAGEQISFSPLPFLPVNHYLGSMKSIYASWDQVQQALLSSTAAAQSGKGTAWAPGTFIDYYQIYASNLYALSKLYPNDADVTAAYAWFAKAAYTAWLQPSQGLYTGPRFCAFAS